MFARIYRGEKLGIEREERTIENEHRWKQRIKHNIKRQCRQISEWERRGKTAG